MEIPECLKDCVQKDGGLHSLGWYLNWEPYEDSACLDGYFSADDLIAIGNYMKSKGGAR